MFHAECACQQHSYILSRWIDDDDLRRQPDRIPLANQRRKVALIPDGYFTITVPGGLMHFFLEVDRGTEQLQRFQQKIELYQAYHHTGLARERYGTERFRVLTVSQSPVRQSNLMTATEAVGGRSRYWFALLSDLHADVVLNEPIWHVAGHEQPAKLMA